MDGSAWEPITSEDRKRIAPESHDVWAPFIERFNFNSVVVPGFAGIDEPQDSVTFDLGPICNADYGSADYELGRRRVNEIVASGFRDLLSPTEPVLLLDWQHPEYWFWPHRVHGYPVPNDVVVGPFPDGDYYVCTTVDLRIGSFGNPMAYTICVWGDELLERVAKRLSEVAPVYRRSGRPWKPSG
jgi:hypothetical protein